MPKTTLQFKTYDGYNDKFFYAKGNTDVELGVIRKTIFGVEASIFINGAWTQEIPVFKGGYTKDCEQFLRKLFANKSLLVDVVEKFRAEQNAKLDAILLNHTS